MNRRSFLYTSLAAALTLPRGVAWAGGPAGHDLPVICYHQIDPRADSEMITTPERFCQHLDYFKQEGFETPTLEQAAAYLNGKAPKWNDKRLLLLTFDDGYEGVYQIALPELKKRGFRGVVFLVVSRIGQGPKPESRPAHLTQEQVQEMSHSGVFEFGSHTWDMHVKIPEDVKSGRLSDYALWRDLVKSRKTIEEWTKKSATSFAWPYGHYDERTLRIAKKAGFRMIFTTDYGKNWPGSGSDRLCRVRLSSVYDTVEVLRRKLK